jgi:transcription initiation factor TFIID subunit 8
VYVYVLHSRLHASLTQGCAPIDLQSFIEALKLRSYSARREQPTPVDFEATLYRFNLTTDSLKPHLKPPIDRKLLIPDTVEVPVDSDSFTRPLPTLANDLSGKTAKEERGYIPSQFPEFPSRHTFVSTPREDHESGRDLTKVNKEVSKAAKQGEDALRRLLRASKIRQQKEVRTQVQSQDTSKQRYRLWELAMEKMMAEQDVHEVDGDMTMADRIADASMIVNSSVEFMRREGAKAARKGGRSSRASVGAEAESR